METITADNYIKIAHHIKLPPAIQYLILLCDKVRLYRKATKTWNDPCEVTRLSRKIISVGGVVLVKSFNTSFVSQKLKICISIII